jgi:homoserine kinase
LLRLAMRDRIHQPYRAPICPLLPRLLPLVGDHGILGAALSGAGPAVLVVVDSERNLAQAENAIRQALGRSIDTGIETELVLSRFSSTGTSRLTGSNPE